MIERYTGTLRQKGIIIRLLEESLKNDDYELWPRKEYGDYMRMLNSSRTYLAGELGFVALHPIIPAEPGEENLGKIPYLCGLYVTKGARKQGIASALVDHLLDDSWGLGRIVTSTPKLNAKLLYEKKGFSVFRTSLDPDHKDRLVVRWYLETVA